MTFDKYRFIGTHDNEKRQLGLQDKQTGVTVWVPYPGRVSKIMGEDVVEHMQEGTGPVAEMFGTLSESLDALAKERLQG